MTSVSGIYVILHKKSGKIYLGQAQSVRLRWNQHRSALKRGEHDNRYLQRAWDKYGAKAFQFKILERCAIDQLDNREDHYLKIYMPKGVCYNIAPNAGTSRGIMRSEETRARISAAHKGMRHSDEARRKISEANLARPPRTLEHSRNQSLGMMGREVSENTRHKIAIGNSERFIVTAPNGNEFEINGLSQFCRDNNLTVGNMSHVANGRRKHHKGWKCRKII